MAREIFFSKLFENDKDQFLFENLDKILSSIALCLSQNFN